MRFREWHNLAEKQRSELLLSLWQLEDKSQLYELLAFLISELQAECSITAERCFNLVLDQGSCALMYVIEIGEVTSGESISKSREIVHPVRIHTVEHILPDIVDYCQSVREILQSDFRWNSWRIDPHIYNILMSTSIVLHEDVEDRVATILLVDSRSGIRGLPFVYKRREIGTLLKAAREQNARLPIKEILDIISVQ